MATFNGEQFLEQQLQSFSAQTQLPAELVVCDDVSSDGTLQIVTRFAQKAPFPVRLIVNERRLGYRANFIKAAGLCSSEYIGYCDQDDVWLSEKLVIAQKYISDTNCTLFQHGFRLIDDDGNLILNGSDFAAVDPREGRWGAALGFTQIFHRSLLEYTRLHGRSIDHNHGNIEMGHDQWAGFVNSLMGKTLTVKDILAHYRQHGRNTFGYRPDRSTKTDLRAMLQINAGRLLGSAKPYREKRDYLIALMDRKATGAGSRAAIIQLLKAEAAHDNLSRLEEELKYYKTYENYYRERLSVYAKPGKLKALKKAASLYLDDSYKNFESRGLKDSVVDLLYGVMG